MIGDGFGRWDGEMSMGEEAYQDALCDDAGRPEPTKTVWITREGKRIPVRELDNFHLVSIIRFLRRKTADTLGLNRRAMTLLNAAEVDDYLLESLPTWERLLREAEGRRMETSMDGWWTEGKPAIKSE